MTEKEKILAVIQHLPENTTIEKAIEELCVLAAVEEGLADVEAGRMISHEQVVSEMQQIATQQRALRHGTTLVD